MRKTYEPHQQTTTTKQQVPVKKSDVMITYVVKTTTWLIDKNEKGWEIILTTLNCLNNF